jgi:N-methylhydantoinase B
MLRRALDIQLLWDRLIAVCEEQALTMVRAAFSPPVREGGDLSAGLFDLRGRMLAQAVTGTPGHVNTMASAVPHFLERFPISSMQEGDSFITNDPWLASGHLHDVTVLVPAFHRGRIAGLFAATVHIVDVGGRGMGTDARDLFEEGVRLPHLHLSRRGELNADLIAILCANSREPDQIEGDLLAILVAGEEGARRLSDALEEFSIADLDEASDHICNASEAATRAAIAALPPGVYRNHLRTDGYEAPVDIHVSMTVGNGGIALDFGGTSARSGYGVNVVLAYTAAYSCYGLKCTVAPHVPNNWGSLRPFTVTAPEGCILNPARPAPVSARHIIGHALPDAVFGCISQAMPGAAPAESGMMWNPYIRGSVALEGPSRDWEIFCFMSGGMGARANADGLDATAFPAGIKNIPVESIEAACPLVFWRKELRPGSGGAGRHRGGHGQIVEIGGLDDRALRVQAMFDRVENPARGRDGGGDGQAGCCRLSSGIPFRAKGLQDVPAGDRLILELPGGGGYGDPMDRSLADHARDAAEGFEP